MSLTVVVGMGGAANAVSRTRQKYLELGFLNSRDAYPLFTSMIPPLEEQNQLLSHDLVTKIKTKEQIIVAYPRNHALSTLEKPMP